MASAERTWLSVRDARRMSLYTGTYLYTLGKKGILETRKDAQNGHRQYSRESVQHYMDAVAAKRKAREERAMSGDDGVETRLWPKACNMVGRMVREDGNLSQGQKDTFLQAIENYRAIADAKYLARKAKSAA